MSRYRLNEEKAEWIIYVTDVGQQQHFDMFFTVRICLTILHAAAAFLFLIFLFWWLFVPALNII